MSRHLSPQVLAQSEQVDVEVLEVVQFEDRGGHHIKVLHVGPTGTVWAADTSSRVSLYRREADAGTGGKGWVRFWRSTPQEAPGGPRFAGIVQVLELESGAVLMLARGAHDSVCHILRAPPGTSAFSVVHSLADPERRILSNQSWFQCRESTGPLERGEIFVGEYTGALEQTGIHIWCSSDDGETWETRALLADIRHIHSLQQDPFHPSRLFLACGDDFLESRWGYSDDGGRTWEWVVAGDGTEATWRKACLVGLIFTEDYLYYGSDSPRAGSAIWRVPRADLVESAVEMVGSTETDRHFRLSTNAGDGLLTFGCADRYSTDGGYTTILGSTDGARWYPTSWRWSRRADAPTAIFRAVVPAHTPPELWVCVTNLAGSELFTGGHFTNCRLRVRRRHPAEAGVPVEAVARLEAARIQRSLPLHRTFSAVESPEFRAPWFRAHGDLAFAEAHLTVTSAIEANTENYWTVDVAAFRDGKYLRDLWKWSTETTSVEPLEPLEKLNSRRGVVMIAEG